MKVIIEEFCDGFAVIVNGERHYFDQEDSISGLIDVVKKINPNADVTHKEIY